MLWYLLPCFARCGTTAFHNPLHRLFIVRIYELFMHISVLHVYIIRRMKYYVNRRLKKYLYRIMQILKLYRFLL